MVQEMIISTTTLYPIIIASPTEIATDNQPAINTHSIDNS